MPKRKRKNQSKPAPDFVKKKRKVGKVKKKEEPLCFKSKSVVVPSQLEVCLGPTTYRKQNVQVLLSQLNHHNSTVRCDALLGLREIFVSHGDQLHAQLARLVERVFPCTVDLTPAVRQAAHVLIQVLTSQVSQDKIAPFFPAIVTQVCCGLTHIDEKVQLDSVKVLDSYLLHYSTLLCAHTSKVMPLLVSLLSRQTSDSSSKPKPSVLQLSSQRSAPSSCLLKLDARLSILEVVCKLLLQELSSSSKSMGVQHQKTDGCTVDLSKRMTYCDAVSMLHNDKDVVSTCHISIGIPHIPILHSHGRISGFSTLFDDASGPSLPSKANCNRELFLDAVSVLVCVIMENWTQEAAALVFSTSSPNVPHVTFISKLIEVLKTISKLLQEFSSVDKNSLISNGEKKKLNKIYCSIKAGILSYIFKHFPFSLSGKSRKDQWSLLEHTCNFMFCHTLLILCKLKADFNGRDSESEDFTSTVAEFLHKFNLQQLVYSSQALSVVAEVTAEVIPLGCQLVEEGLDEGVAAKFFSFALRLYNESCHPQSSSKQLLIECLRDVFLKEIAKKGDFHKSMVYKHLLMPWSTSLVSLLSDTRGVSPPTFSAAIEAMLVCVKHGNLDIAHELAAKLECVFGCDSYLRQAPVSTQRRALELLWYMPILEAEQVKALGKFAATCQLDMGVVQYLIQIMHHKYILDAKPDNIMRNLPRYLHFMFAILLGKCHRTDLHNNENITLELSEKNIACEKPDDAFRIQQTVCECIHSAPVSISDVLRCLKVTLLHQMLQLHTARKDDFNDKEVEEEAKKLLKLV